MTQLRKLEEQVAAWPHVSVHPHRFGGREFRFGNAELGHVHLGGTVDIPFPRNVRGNGMSTVPPRCGTVCEFGVSEAELPPTNNVISSNY